MSRPHLLALGAFLAFSLMPVFTRGANAAVLGVSAWRAVAVALVFGVWAALAEGEGAGARRFLAPLRPDRATLRLGVAYGLALAVASASFVGGYALTTVANTVFLHNLAPMAAFPLAWWAFRERPSPAALTGGAVALVGVALLSGVSLFHFAHLSNPRFLTGDLLALLSAAGYAAVIVSTRAARQRGTPLLGTLFVAWSVAAVVLCLHALATGLLLVPAASIPWILGLAVVSTALPFYLLNLSMRQLGAGLTAVLSMTEVVGSSFLGMAVFDERLAPIGWMGGALVMVGVAYPLLRGPEVEAQPGGEVEPLGEGSRPWRAARLLLALGLFNAGALLALAGGVGGGALLAAAGIGGLVRLGPPYAAFLLEGRFRRAIRWGTAAIAVAVLAGAIGRGGGAGGSWAAFAFALAALLGDRALAAREAEPDRDEAPLLRAALVVFAAAQVAGRFGHPSEGWLGFGAAALVAASCWTVLLAAWRGALPDRPVRSAPGVAALDAIPPLLSRPRLLAPLALCVLALGGVRIVPPGHEAVIERLGYPLAETVPPGLLVRLPPPVEVVTLADVARVRDLAVTDEATPFLCGDQSMAALRVSLQYRVSDARDFVFATTDPEHLLGRMARAALVAATARRSHDEVLTTGRRDLEDDVKARTQAGADDARLGLHVEAVNVLAASVPAPVLASFLDVISAEEEKRTRVNQAEAYAADILPKAAGTAIARVEDAGGRGVVAVARAEAQAARFVALSEGGRPSPDLTRFRLSREAAEAVLGEARVVVVSPGIDLWLERGGRTEPAVSRSP